jgi:hypothetical protein
MIRLGLILSLLILPAAAQIREFSCVGSEQLEEENVAILFPPGRDRVVEAELAPLRDLVAIAQEEPERNLCVLGFAGPQEGGAETASRLAARRARSISLELAKMGIERDRIRAEARTRGFLDPARRSRSGGVSHTSGVRVVLLPAAEPPPSPRPPT